MEDAENIPQTLTIGLQIISVQLLFLQIIINEAKHSWDLDHD